MFGLGTIVNTIAVVAGGIIGLLFKNGLKNRYQETVMQGIGLAVLFVGISGAMTGMLKISKSIIESTGSSFNFGFVFMFWCFNRRIY